MIEKILKIGLAILLFLCLIDMPYGFYQIVRFVALVAFAYLAFKAYQNNSLNETLLFQPFFKIALGRDIWNIVDVIVGIGLVVSLVLKPKTK